MIDEYPGQATDKRGRLLVTIVLLFTVTVATFAADRLLPLGVAVWMLYLVPVVLTTQLLPQYTGLALGISSGLLLVGVLDSKEGISYELAVINRGLGLIVLLFTGLFLLQHRRMAEALRESEGRYRLLLEQHGRAARGSRTLHEHLPIVTRCHRLCDVRRQTAGGQRRVCARIRSSARGLVEPRATHLALVVSWIVAGTIPKAPGNRQAIGL
jgi:hypothetical protein